MTSGIDLAGVEAKTARNKSRGSSAIHRSVYLWGGGWGGGGLNIKTPCLFGPLVARGRHSQRAGSACCKTAKNRGVGLKAHTEII